MQIVSQKYKTRGFGCSMIGGRSEYQYDMGYKKTPLSFMSVACDEIGEGTLTCRIINVLSSPIFEPSKNMCLFDGIKRETKYNII